MSSRTFVEDRIRRISDEMLDYAANYCKQYDVVGDEYSREELLCVLDHVSEKLSKIISYIESLPTSQEDE